jgi:GH18 family chitinase
MLKDESTRKKFVDDSVNFLQKFEFDGLDLDFECKIRLNLAFKKNI